MQFTDIPGNIEVKKRLIKSVNNNRIAHAQLFLGPEGSAKLALAIAYARYLNCTSRTNKDSCNNCHSCSMYNNLSHPDFHIIFPVVKTKGIKNPVSDNFIKEWRRNILKNPYVSLSNWHEILEAGNKQAIIYVGEAEKIKNKLSLKAYDSKYKVVLIWMPEKMHTHTANKLLKLFEEPPRNTVILMVSVNQELLLPTIVSRIQIIKTNKFNSNEIANYLKEKINTETQLSTLIANNAKGSLNLAIKKAQEETSLLPDFQKWMQICYTIKLDILAEWVDEIAKAGRQNQKALLEYSINIIRETFLIKIINQKRLKNNEELFVKNFSPFIHESNIHSIYKKINEASNNILKNGNPRIIFYELSLHMIQLLKLKNNFV